MLLAFVLLGRALEERAKIQVGEALIDKHFQPEILARMFPTRIHLHSLQASSDMAALLTLVPCQVSKECGAWCE